MKRCIWFFTFLEKFESLPNFEYLVVSSFKNRGRWIYAPPPWANRVKAHILSLFGCFTVALYTCSDFPPREISDYFYLTSKERNGRDLVGRVNCVNGINWVNGVNGANLLTLVNWVSWMNEVNGLTLLGP